MEGYELTLGESDTDAYECDRYAMKFKTSNGATVSVGHIPKYISKICCKFVNDVGELDAEVIGKRFNAGQGMGVEVPVELRFVGNQQYLKRVKNKIVMAVADEVNNSNINPDYEQVVTCPSNIDKFDFAFEDIH